MCFLRVKTSIFSLLVCLAMHWSNGRDVVTYNSNSLTCCFLLLQVSIADIEFFVFLSLVHYLYSLEIYSNDIFLFEICIFYCGAGRRHIKEETELETKRDGTGIKRYSLFWPLGRNYHVGNSIINSDFFSLSIVIWNFNQCLWKLLFHLFVLFFYFILSTYYYARAYLEPVEFFSTELDRPV